MKETIFSHEQIDYSESPQHCTGNSNGSCRFCLSANPKFKNRSHSIPEFLGNKTAFTLDECDDCNKLFGNGIEKSLKDFLMPGWFYRAKGKKGRPTEYAAGGASIFADDKFININLPKGIPKIHETLEFNSKEVNTLKSYKALLKILISLLPDEFLLEFARTIHWLKNGHDFSFLTHKPLAIIGNQLPDQRLPTIMAISLQREVIEGGAMYVLDMRINNIYVKLPFSTSTMTAHFRLGEGTPADTKYEEVHFSLVDFSTAPKKRKFKLSLNLTEADGGNRQRVASNAGKSS